MITSDWASSILNENLKPFKCESFGLLGETCLRNVISFVGNSNYIEQLNSNSNISVVFVREEDCENVCSTKVALVVDDPVYAFFTLVDAAAKSKSYLPSKIDDSVKISEGAAISDQGVVIGKNVLIEPNVVIHSGTSISDNVIVRAGAVLGGDGFEHKRTSKGVLSVAHDGELIVESDVEIGSNTFIAKGFSYRPTIIGAESKLDTLIHYAHGVQCGKRCFIVSNAMLGGNCSIGDDVWIGPSVSIANRLTIGDKAYLTMGSVVTKDVAEGQQVTGNFAIPHEKFLGNLKRGLS